MPKLFTLVSICIVLASCSSNKKQEANNKPNVQPPVVVDVLIAEKKNIATNIEVNGTVLPFENLEIHPETSGRLVYLSVNDGAVVKANQVLAKINDAELQAQLTKSQTQLNLASKTEERLRKLLAVQGINQADYDAALNQVNNLKADIELLKAQLDKTIVKAPFAGVLGLRQISPGAYVTPQTTITSLLQTNKVKIDFSVPETYAEEIVTGKEITVQSALKKINATVIATEPEINEATRNLKVRALIKEDNIKAGSFVKVLIANNNKNTSNLVVVPTSAIIPEAKSKKLVIVKDGKGKFVNVETGLRTAGGVQITKGIEVGDSIVVTGVLFVRPNSNLKVRSIKKLDELVQ